MNDLISRQAAIDALGEEPPVWYDGDDEIAERNQWRRDKAAIESLPSAEPKTGEWIDDIEAESNGYYWANCSQCGLQIDVHENRGYQNYCPNCGADMREGDNNGNGI